MATGRRRGTLYVNWIDERHGDPDVFVMRSGDLGASWSAPVRVNDDPVGNGAAQFFTWMAVDPADGSVNVVFYDRRGLDGTMTGVTLARSLDGGRTFVNHPIDLDPFACNPDVFFGDYTGIDARDGLVIPIFMHFVDRDRDGRFGGALRVPARHAAAQVRNCNSTMSMTITRMTSIEPPCLLKY